MKYHELSSLTREEREAAVAAASENDLGGWIEVALLVVTAASSIDCHENASLALEVALCCSQELARRERTHLTAAATIIAEVSEEMLREVQA